MLLEFLSFSSFSLVVLHFGYRYRQHKESIPEPEYRIPIVDRILIALYVNMAGQFVQFYMIHRWRKVRAIFRVTEFCVFIKGFVIVPEVYLYVFDALPILCCTLAFAIILPWQLDYGKAVGDVLEKLEWGLLFPIVWPIKTYIKKQKEKRQAKGQEITGNPSVDASTHELGELNEPPK
jgi:hypothetical protein